MAASLGRVRAGRPHRAATSRRPGRAHGDARVREGRASSRSASARAPAHGRSTHLVERTRRAHAADRRAVRPATPAPNAGIGRRRALVPQLDVGHDRPAQDRDAQPGALVRVPRVRATGSRSSRADDVFLSALPAPFGFGCGPRTSRRRSSARRASCASASRAEAVLRRDRALPRHGARRGVDAVRDAAELARDRRARPVVAARPVHRRRDGAVRASAGVRGTHRRGRCCSSTAATRPARCRRPRSTIRPRRRLRTAGRVIPEMHVRLLDPDTDADITATGGPGVPAGKGPTLCLGYWDDPSANERALHRRRLDAHGRSRDDRRRRLPHRRRPHVRLHHPRRQEHQRRAGRRRGRLPSRRSRCARRSRCPTRRSASACACSPSSAPGTTT